MKVCLINSIFPPYGRGGAEVVVEATAQAFAQAGHEVFVITCTPFEGWGSFAGKWEIATDKSLAFSSKLSFDGLRVFRFTPLNLFTIFNIGKYPPLLRVIWHVIDMFNVHTYLVVKKIFEKEKPDLIITRNLKGLGYTIPMAIRSTFYVLRSTKWFHGLHDLGALHPRGFMEWGKEDAIRRPIAPVRLYRAVARRLFGSPDVIIAPSQFVLDEYNRAGFFSKSKKVVMLNPVMHNPSQPPSPGLQPPSPLGRGEGEGQRGGDETIAPLMKRFLYIGQLEPYKGLRVLIGAWKSFGGVHPEARLEIIGQGSMAEEIRRAAQSIRGIVYRGALPHGELTAAFEGACATIFPTLAYETFGLVVAESLAAGVPVIASAIGAIPEHLHDEKSGILIPPGDPSALTNALERVVTMRFSLDHAAALSPLQYREALEKLAQA